MVPSFEKIAEFAKSYTINLSSTADSSLLSSVKIEDIFCHSSGDKYLLRVLKKYAYPKYSNMLSKVTNP